MLIAALLVGSLTFAMSHRGNGGVQNTVAQNTVGGDTNTAPYSSPTQKTTSSSVYWMQTADGYQASSTPPTCPAQMVAIFPADITQATSVLYPGQYRGGSYKPHGGLRFDNATNNVVVVKAPFDGTIIDGSAYIADGALNDVQYTFDVMNNCGMMFRVGHLLTLSPDMAAIAKNFPAPQKNDSRTTNVNPGVKITAGTVMATKVGTATDKNTFFDFGVYDWNKANAISADAAWLAGDQHNSNLGKHAVCWFSLLTAADEATVRALPAGDPTSGKKSDYCN